MEPVGYHPENYAAYRPSSSSHTGKPTHSSLSLKSPGQPSDLPGPLLFSSGTIQPIHSSQEVAILPVELQG